MATITLRAGNQPEMLPVGVNAAVCHVSLSVSWSSGDVHNIGKIPVGAIPLDVVWYPGAASPAAFIAKFGTSASQELFFASDSWAETQVPQRNIRKLGYAMQISISDEAPVRYENITMVATAGTSIGFVGDLVVFYKMPGQSA